MVSNLAAMESTINAKRRLRLGTVWGAGLLLSACANESPLPLLAANPSASASTVIPESSVAVTIPPPVTSSALPTTTTSAAPPTTTTSPETWEPGETASGPASSEPAASSADERPSSSSEGTEGVLDPTAGEAAIAALEAYLDAPFADRPAMDEQDFVDIPLSAAQASAAGELLWQDHVERIRETRASEHEQKSITIGDYTLRYDYTMFGEAPAAGRSLYISLHGGGETEASVNDDQWENQKLLYQPDEGIYLSPRAPTDTWNMWHQDHIDSLLERLIENFVALGGVDSNRVYVMGYSAGGDGVYQLGPRMADHWAAASAMAGHPNEAKPLSLRNLGFTIHVGGEDTAFDRNLVAVEWREQLEELQAADPLGYEHFVEVHVGKPHWMDLEDAVAVPWMAEFTRDPAPKRVVWYQDDILHDRFYWLRDLAPRGGSTMTAEVSGQQVTIQRNEVERIGVMLSDAIVDLDQSVTIVVDDEVKHEGVVSRTIRSLHTTLVERGDPALMFSALIAISP